MNIRLTHAVLVALFGVLIVGCNHDDDDDDRVNMAPTITSVPDQLIEANKPSPTILFQVDDDANEGELTVSASSDNPALLGSQSFDFRSAGSARSVRITPTAAQLGVANVTLTVTDADGASAQTAFQVTVDRQQVSASTFVQDVFNDAATDTPQDLNSRVVVNNAEDTDFFTLLAP